MTETVSRSPASPRRKILFLTTWLDRGGAERVLLQLLPGLDRGKYDIRLFAFRAGGRLEADFRAAGIAVTAPGPRLPAPLHLLIALPVLIGLVATWRPHLFQFVLPEAYVFGAPVSFLRRGAKRIMARRSTNFYFANHPVLARFERRLHRRMDAITFNGTRLRQELLAEGAPADRLVLIHNGFDAAPFENPPPPAATRKALGVSMDCLTILCAANLYPYKGHRDLLAALAKAGFDRDWVCLIAGRDEGEEAGLRIQADGLGIAERVRFLGPRSDVPALMAAADFIVHPSHEEGLPNAVGEAGLAGRAAVATTAGGTADLVVHGETGLLVPPGEPTMLARGMRELADDPKACQSMGAAARKRMLAGFTLSSMIAAHEALYDRLLDD